MTTTKSDLANAVAEANGFPLNKSVEIIEALIDLIKTKLAAGEDALISGFGKFCVKKKRERRGRCIASSVFVRHTTLVPRCYLGGPYAPAF